MEEDIDAMKEDAFELARWFSRVEKDDTISLEAKGDLNCGFWNRKFLNELMAADSSLRKCMGLTAWQQHYDFYRSRW